MALKNTWVDKIDGLDYVKSKDINDIAGAVIDLENEIETGGAGGSGGSANAVLFTEQNLTESQQTQARENIGADAAEPLIVGTEIGTKCAEFSAKLNNTDKAESFLFFTDPHLLDGNFDESKMHKYLQMVKQYSKCTPTTFVMCGGDWIGNSDTPECACFKLGYLDGYCRALFNPYYPVVGNHDTNYQGKLDADSAVGTGTLTNETIRNLMVRDEENLYYAFDGSNTRFYVLDTGSDWDNTLTAYRAYQLGWLAEKLQNEDKEFSAIAMHITYVSSGDGYALSTFAQNVMQLLNVYHSRSSATLNGKAFDYSNCTGIVKFIISGHTHADMVETVNGVPVIVTTQLKDGDTPSFDLCLADYDNDVIHLVRVGTGESREVELYHPEERTLVMIPNFGFSSFEYLSYPARLGVCTTERTPDTIPALTNGNGVTGGPYYPVAFADTKRSFSVTCPGCQWAVRYVYVNSSGVWANYKDSGWLESGVTYELTNTYPTHYLLQFKTADGSKFPADISGISWTIE